MMNYQAFNLATQVMVMALVISVVLLFLGIGVLIFIHICIVGRTYRRGLGNGGMVDRGSTGSTSMSRDDIEKLPCFDYIAKSKGSSPVDCAVCLENFKKGDKCRLLPLCNHSFHAPCVDAWLLKNPNCPICRSTADSRRFGEESSRFSDISMVLRENQPTDQISIELRENQPTDQISMELRENQPTDQISMELRENQPTDQSRQPGAIRIELGANQIITQISHFRDDHPAIGSRENQTNLLGTTPDQLGSNLSPLPNSSSLENV